MKIFHESKNKYVQATILLMNRIYNGECIPEKYFDKEFLEEAKDNGSGLGLEYLTRLKKEYKLFDLSDKNRVKLSINAPVVQLPSASEKMWLKSALELDLMKLFLSEDCIDRLKASFDEAPVMKLSEIIDVKGLSNTADFIDEAFIDKFRTVLRAIHSQSYLSYCNISRDGDKYKNNDTIPYKIEYSVTQQRFAVSIWLPAEQRPIKSNIASMYQVTCGDSVTDRQFATVREMLEQRKAPEPLAIKIFNKNNAVERASLLFSQYDRVSRWEEDGTFIMQINYYTFDEDELMSNILSFGPLVKVLAPKHFIERVISIINI